MDINIAINGKQRKIAVSPSETLFAVLRRLGLHGVKFGDEQGLTGADTVILDGNPVNSGSLLAAQAEGHNIVTIESLGEISDQGWKKTSGLHPLQQAFIETGAIQCGYCTPAQILAAKALLDKNPNPTEGEIRQAIAGVLCRCTGYAKPVQAILQAAAVLRGEKKPGEQNLEMFEISFMGNSISPDALSSAAITQIVPKIVLTPETKPYQVVGKPEPKVDALKLAQGKPAFTADFEIRGLLYAKVLHSPHAHARILRIDASQGTRSTGCGRRFDLAGHPSCGLFHCRAV